jgi:hypothetical protein
MRDYNPEWDDWTHQVVPRRSRIDQPLVNQGLCRNGMDHEYASGECVLCEAPDPFEDRPSIVHAYDTREGQHICFDGCRHARNTEGRYLRPQPDWE